MVQVGEGFRFRTKIVLDSESIVSTNHSNHLQHSVRNAPGNTLRCTEDGEIKLIRLEFAAHSRHQNNGRAIGNCRGNRQSATESRQKRWPGLFFLLPLQNCQVVQVDGASRWEPGSNYLGTAATAWLPSSYWSAESAARDGFPSGSEADGDGGSVKGLLTLWMTGRGRAW